MTVTCIHMINKRTGTEALGLDHLIPSVLIKLIRLYEKLLLTTTCLTAPVYTVRYSILRQRKKVTRFIEDF